MEVFVKYISIRFHIYNNSMQRHVVSMEEYFCACKNISNIVCKDFKLKGLSTA